VPACTGDHCPVFSSYDMTEEGPAHVEQLADNTVIICESFDESTANQLRSAWLAKSSSTQADNFSQDELGLRLRQMPGFDAFQHQVGLEILRSVISSAQ